MHVPAAAAVLVAAVDIVDFESAAANVLALLLVLELAVPVLPSPIAPRVFS